MFAMPVIRTAMLLMAAATQSVSASCQLSDIQIEGPPEGALRISAWWPDHDAPAFVLATDVASNPQRYVVACADAECDAQALYALDASHIDASRAAVFADTETAEPSVLAVTASGLSLYRCRDRSCVSRQTQLLANTAGVTRHSNVVTWGSEWAFVYAAVGVEQGDLMLRHCLDAACATSSTQRILDLNSNLARATLDLALDRSPDGSLVIASLDTELSAQPETRYRYTYCDDADCAQVLSRVLDQAPPSPDFARVAVLAQPNGRSLFLQARQNDPRLIECLDIACTGYRLQSLPNQQNDWYTGLVVGESGQPVLGLIRASEAGFLQCLDSSCQNWVERLMPMSLSSPLAAELKRNQQGDLLLTHIDREEGQGHGTRCITNLTTFQSGFEAITRP